MQNIGKIFYYLIFFIFTFTIKIATSTKNKVWPRNSLLQNYFSFGKSDLDLTILISNEKDLWNQIKKARSLARFFIITKEINFYYPFVISINPSPINYFEWSRDSKLNRFLMKDPDLKDSASEKIVYLLNILPSMKKNMHDPLDERAISKWNFHLNSIFPGKISLKHGITSLDILEETCPHLFPEDSKEISSKLATFFQSRKDQVPLHIFMDSVEDKDFYLTFFSHIYSYMQTAPVITSKLYSEIFIKQIAWETWAMMTQPWLFKENKEAYNHLESLYRMLLDYKERNTAISKEASILMDHIKSYQLFLSDIF